MIIADILHEIGHFTIDDHQLFEKHITKMDVKKNELLLKAGMICQSFYFIVEGSFVQYVQKELDEQVVDLHVRNEWMFNQESVTQQTPSLTTIKAFSDAKILSVNLHDFHYLCSKSSSFLHFGKILNQNKFRTDLFDHDLNPTEKYKYINHSKPELTKVFPLKLIASFLKITPETLSRVRATY